ncbi:MAG: glycoside hydrolase family 17 [Nitrospinae bacterium]|nr:glycoside hydrolase family 17 [Nitrospinota bacterium]
MNRFIATAAFIAASAVYFSMWWWMGLPVDLPDVPGGRFDCMSYSPYDGNTTPLDSNYSVSPDRIRADLLALKPYTGCLRTYSSRGPLTDTARIASELGFQILQGIWISPIAKENDKEIDAALKIVQENPHSIRGLIVGNEVLLRRDLSGRELAGIIRSVKDRAKVPVLYADIFEFWKRNPEVAEAVDTIAIHILPYWDDPEPFSINDVQDHVAGIVAEARAVFPGRSLMIGEIGWPSAGRTRGGAVPTLINEARFLREFTARAGELNLPYNIIEAMDQPWKRKPEGTVGGYWGIIDFNRSAKFPLTGPVSSWPNWRMAFLASIGIALLLFVGAVIRWRELSFGRWLAIAAWVNGIGSLITLQADFLAESSLYGLEWGVGITLMAVGLAMALMALPALVRGGLPVLPAPFSEVAAWLRRPKGFTPELRLGLLHCVVGVYAAITDVWLAFDPRHRDIPIALFLLPAAAMMVRWLSASRAGLGSTKGREEAWLAFIMLGLAPFTLDGLHNREAMAWAGTSVMLALPWIGAARLEFSRLLRFTLAPDQTQ